MLRFCGLIIALTLSVPVHSQEPVTEPVTIEASTPEGLIAKALGVQLEAVVVTLIKGRESSKEVADRTDRARQAFDRCGGCPEARAELDAARSFERRQRGYALSVADDIDRQLGDTKAKAMMKMILGDESKELSETKYAERLVAFYCISQIGLEYDWNHIDSCKSKISAAKILDMQHESVKKCNMHSFGEKCRNNLPFAIIERTIAGVCHTRDLKRTPEYKIESAFLGDCKMGQISSKEK
jgi:hypothetical protein